jgi:acetyl-CoA acetyltransferase
MKEVVIVDAVRTPVGNHRGMLRDFDAVARAQIVIKGHADKGLPNVIRNEFKFFTNLKGETK